MKFTRAYLFQIALEIMWLPIQKKKMDGVFLAARLNTVDDTESTIKSIT